MGRKFLVLYAGALAASSLMLTAVAQEVRQVVGFNGDTFIAFGVESNRPQRMDIASLSGTSSVERHPSRAMWLVNIEGEQFWVPESTFTFKGQNRSGDIPCSSGVSQTTTSSMNASMGNRAKTECVSD
ncbi:MAG: hypothetical protein AAFO57_06435 [Pseudomonadota bacterium]